MPKGQKKHPQKVDPHIKQSNQNNLVLGFPEEYLKTAIVEGIMEAEKQKKELLTEEEKQEQERIRKRNRELLAKKKDKPDGEITGLKLVWRFLWAKEDLFIEAGLMPSFINAFVSLSFGLIEYGLYGLALLNIVIVVQEVLKSNEEFIVLFPLIVTRILRALAVFLMGRVLFRTLKIECKYNKDKDYMLNLLTLIIALATLIFTIVKQ